MNRVVPDHVTCSNTGAWIFKPSKGEQALEMVRQLLDAIAKSEDLPESIVEAADAIRRSA